MIQTNPAEFSHFRVKIVPEEFEQMKKQKSDFGSLEGIWDPIEKEEDKDDEYDREERVRKTRQSVIDRMNDFFNPSIPLSPRLYTLDPNAMLATRDYRGEKTTPIYPKYNCKIPIKCFKRPKFNEAWMSYRAIHISHGHTTQENSFFPALHPPKWIFEFFCHRTNKSVLVRSRLESEVDGVTGSYCLANTLSYQDIIDFLSVNFIHLKEQISLENEDFSEEKVHKLACMFTAVRYVALIQGYFGNDKPSHWEIVKEEEIKEKISKEVIQEIYSMKSDVLKLIIATAAFWWAADFSVGGEGQFPPLLKKMLLDLKTLRPIFKDFMGSEKEMQLLVHKATHCVDKRNVLKALNMDNDEWTGEIPVGLPVIKKVDIDKLGNYELSEVLKRVPAGYSSYSNCHKVLKIMENYKLAMFLLNKNGAELVNSVIEEISKKPNYHHINSSYLNKNDSRFKKPKRYYKNPIRNILIECWIFLFATRCHRGLFKSTIFNSVKPATAEEFVRLCPNWLFFLHAFIRDEVRVEKVKQDLNDDDDHEKNRKNHPFSESPTSVLMHRFASSWRITDGYIYWKDENGVLLIVGHVQRTIFNDIKERDFCGFKKLFSK